MCLTGKNRKHGCSLTTAKSVRIVESALLTYIKSRILTPSNVERCLVMANAFLAEYAKKPKADVTCPHELIHLLVPKHRVDVPPEN
jgi:hypothetical protein